MLSLVAGQLAPSRPARKLRGTAFGKERARDRTHMLMAGSIGMFGVTRQLGGT